MEHNEADKRKQENNAGDWAWFTEFAGVTMVSNYYTLHLISRIMSENPQLKGIMEFGTYWGSIALYLGLEGWRKQIPVYSIDVTSQVSPDTARMLDKLGVQRQIADLFNSTTKNNIAAMLKEFPVYLFIDNGDKPREFKEYVPLLKPGSIVSVHDYQSEFFDEDWHVHETLVTPYKKEEWLNHNSQLATFIVR